jgi:alcohol dehydrogenase, propanol-preferring
MMKSYRVFEFGQPLKCTEVAPPSLTEHGALVRVRAAGVCHSDIHIWDGGYDLGHGKRLLLKDRGVNLPLTMGHEIVGEIVAVGPQVRDRKVGEICLVFPWIGCGTCRVCRDDEENLCMNPCCLGVHCDGGYSDHVAVAHERYLLPIGDLDPAVVAPFACSGLTTYSALKKLGTKLIEEEPVLILGAGGLGLMCLSILKGMGGMGAVVVDIDEKKRAAAMAAGALAAVDGNAPRALADIRQAMGGPTRGAIDLVGNPETAALGFNALAKGGKLVCIGLFGGAAPWSLPLLPVKAATLQGSFTGSLPEMRELLDLVRSGAVPAIPIDRKPLDEATAILERLREGKQIGRAVLIPA